VCLAVKPVGKPDAVVPHVRFDERGWETERCRMAQATAPILDSTKTERTEASNQRKLLWHNDFTSIQGSPDADRV
jgi:hypothetical protein